MKCPYRYVTKSTAMETITVEETEEFAECYEGPCPFYDETSEWRCLRAKAEFQGGVQSYD